MQEGVEPVRVLLCQGTQVSRVVIRSLVAAKSAVTAPVAAGDAATARATGCRDLKDMLSQHGKVLFVDEPRSVRTAVVHFATPEDRAQVFSAFKRTGALGSQLDMVPVRPRTSLPSAGACLLYTSPSPRD